MSTDRYIRDTLDLLESASDNNDLYLTRLRESLENNMDGASGVERITSMISVASKNIEYIRITYDMLKSRVSYLEV